MKILILGGTNFIGPRVVRRLTQAGHEVILFHRGETIPDENIPASVQTVRGDRNRLQTYQQHLRNLTPDVVLDTCAMTRDHAQSAVETFDGFAGRYVVLSSCDVYRAYGKLIGLERGRVEATPLDEDAPLRERHFPYRAPQARSHRDPNRWRDDYEKILVERAAQAVSSLPATVLRLPMVYGPGDPYRRLLPFLKRMADGRPVILLEEQYAEWHPPFGFVENVASAIVRAVEDSHAAGRIYNVVDEPQRAQPEWVRDLGQAVGWQGDVVLVPSEELPAHLRTGLRAEQDLRLDSGRIRRELGWREPVPRLEAILATSEWEKANPPKAFEERAFDYQAEDNVLIGRKNTG